MFTKTGFLSLSLVLIMGLMMGCSPRIDVQKSPSVLHDGAYAPYPTGFVSKDLETIAKSVYKVNGIAFYNTYYFTRKQAVHKADMPQSLLYRNASYHSVTHQSTMGSATMIYADGLLAALVSCAHVVHFDDTLVTYFSDQPEKIYSISIRLKQDIFVAGLKNNRAIVVAKDDEKDIAILKLNLSQTIESEKPVKISYPIGKSSDLKWGSFIYALGFPMGQKMLSQGVVSESANKNKGYILSDAVFNRGYSGAPVFAVRDGAPHFEWVGMVRSGVVDKLLYVQPRINDDQFYSKKENYEGEIFVNNKMVIKYGLTYSIPIEEIVMFVHQHESEIRAAGFQQDILF